jgi:hypothetical protein
MTALQSLVAAELDEPVDPRIAGLASAIAAQHGAAARAVLFYGSCLRESKLDGLMLDFYLIVSDYRAAYAKRWLATANRLIPPNVFPFALDGVAAKYAVLSVADFAALNRPEASNVSVWARFSQPTRLVWSADEASRAACIDAVAAAAPTLLSLASPIANTVDLLDVWRAGYAETYRAELRAERTTRSGSIVDADPARYTRIGVSITLPTPGMTKVAAVRKWRQLQRKGKILSILRLAKASLTFAGGIDYLAWKINRHAGTKIEIQPWQRRLPLVAALFLVPKLLRSGAVK